MRAYSGFTLSNCFSLKDPRMANSSDNNCVFDVFHETIAFRTAPKNTRMITNELSDWIENIGAVSGSLTVLCMHTSASITIQENADPTVQDDILDYLNDIAPENRRYAHSLEGPDDMPAHLKTMLTSASIPIPVKDGYLVLGQWQGVFLMEHRAQCHHRQLHLCFTGLLKNQTLEPLE